MPFRTSVTQLSLARYGRVVEPHFCNLALEEQMQSTHQEFKLPNGHTLRYETRPELSNNAYVLKVMDGEKILSVTCSCNGASATCATGNNVSCDCTKSPPVLSCS